MNVYVHDPPDEGARDLIDVHIEQQIPGAVVLEHVVVSPDEGCSIVLDNPEGAQSADRLRIPIQELEGRIVQLPERLGGKIWLLVSFAHLEGQIIRGRQLAQWKNLWENRCDFDVFRTDGREYFA